MAGGGAVVAGVVGDCWPASCASAWAMAASSTLAISISVSAPTWHVSLPRLVRASYSEQPVLHALRLARLAACWALELRVLVKDTHW